MTDDMYERALEKMRLALPVAERVLRDDLLRALLVERRDRYPLGTITCGEADAALAKFVGGNHG
jgi:hypothetical protein